MYDKWLMRQRLKWSFIVFNIICFAPIFTMAIDISDSMKKLDREYAQTFKIATSRWQEGYFEAAFALMSQAYELARSTGDREKEAQALMDLGKLSWAVGEQDESRGFYTRALDACREINLAAKEEECRLALRVLDLYNKGKTDRLQGNLMRSFQNLLEAVQIAQKMGSDEHEVKCLRQLSLTAWAKQERESFLSLNLNALLIAKKIKDLKEQAKCLSNLGMYFFWRKDYLKALDHYSQSLELAKEVRSREEESLSLNNISLILMHLGFYEKSADFLESTLALYPEKWNVYFLCQTFNNIGEAYRNKGLLLSTPHDLVRAIDYFHRALEVLPGELTKKTQMKIFNNMGKTYLDLGKRYTARHYLEAALEAARQVQDDEASLRILVNLGYCHLEARNLEKAQEYLERALEIEKKIGSTRLLWEIFFSLARIGEKKGDYGRALTFHESALEAIDKTRIQIAADDFKAGFMRNKFKVYESLADLLFRLYEKNPEISLAQRIFYLAERAKARAFLETLGETEVSPGRPVIASLPGERMNDKALSPGLMRETAGKELEKTIPPPVNPEKVQATLLDEKTAVIEYFLGEKRSLLFLLTKSTLTLYALPPREEIRASLSPYLMFLSRPPRAQWDWRKASHRLSQDLLGPIWKDLPASIARLIIVPDDVLCHLPFETLVLPDPEESLLLKKYAISYAPSCSSLLYLKEKKMEKPFSRGLLAFGNPSYISRESKKRLTIATLAKAMAEEQGLELTPLEESKKEIRAIGRHFPEGKRDIYLGKEANEENVKSISLEDYQVIHFACHGYVDEKVPFRSGLFLSLDHGGEDGFLQASEIASLKLDAELVVLSACRTSRGYLERGEGIMGLTRTFFYSGARSVVSTLWKIGDRAAAKFMRIFYDSLAQEKGKAEALRSAKLRFLESRFSHPFYWAAFVLHGDGSTAIHFR